MTNEIPKLSRLVLLLSVVSASSALVPVSCIPPPPLGYTETVFSDEFSLGHVDTNIWHYDLGTSYPGGAQNWGTGEIQTYTASRENIKINSEGNLQITPRKKSNGTWTSSRIETKAGYDIACPDGGKLYIEAKVKIGSTALSEDRQMGIWPAFWMLGAAFRGVWTNWPHVGEIDIIETANGRLSVWNTIHCGTDYYGGPCKEPNGIGSGPSPFARGVWHTIGFEIDRDTSGLEAAAGTSSYPRSNATEPWMHEKLRWFVDGVETFRVTPEALSYDKPAWKSLTVDSKFILLNVAVGGGFANGIAGGKFLPDNSTIGGEEVDMEVNYVVAWTTH